MSLQKSHEAVNNAHHDLEITVVAENIRTPENLGMILRISEAFGVKKIYFVGTLGIHFSTKAKRAARNTHTLKNHEFLANGEELLSDLKNANAQLIALEITQTSSLIHQVKFDYQKPLVIIVGSEREGISEELLRLSDQSVHIQMYGENSSLNVTNALSIALHQILINYT